MGVQCCQDFAARNDGSQGLAGPQNPASADVLVIYCTGLGLVEPRGIAGSATPATPLSTTVEAVTVTIGGVEASVLFAGLTPGFTGLYQINVAVPGGIGADLAAPLVVTQGGRASRGVSIAVR